LVCLFCWRKYVDRSWDYINRSQTHECGNWGWDRAIPRNGIHKWNFVAVHLIQARALTLKITSPCNCWLVSVSKGIGFKHWQTFSSFDQKKLKFPTFLQPLPPFACTITMWKKIWVTFNGHKKVLMHRCSLCV
jgi:hypothetical protein